MQQKLYEEVSTNANNSKSDGLSEALLSTSPYLHAVIRETHRMTPALPISLVKDNTHSDVELHGVTIAKGRRFMLEAYSIGMDPAYVPDYRTFRPKCWLDNEVQNRSGTSTETTGPLSLGALVNVLDREWRITKCW